jgi:hypothetical protein
MIAKHTLVAAVSSPSHYVLNEGMDLHLSGIERLASRTYCLRPFTLCLLLDLLCLLRCRLQL